MFEKLFNFENVGNFMETMANAANQQVAAAKQQAETTLAAQQEITDSAAGYNAEAKKTLERLQGIEQSGNKARALAESDNIFDRITLIGEQIINPREYTREGRMNQMQEMSADLAMRGQIHNIQVVESQSKIAEAESQRIIDTADTDGKMATLRATVDGMQLMAQGMYATESIRKQQLLQMDIPALQQSLAGPIPSDGKIVLGGMKYTPLELKERANDLQVRQELSLLSPDISNPEYARIKSIQQNRILADTYKTPQELLALKDNDYTLPDGSKVSPQLWDEHYQRANALEMDTIQRLTNQATLENQVPMQLDEGLKLATAVQKYATPGTPLAIARNTYMDHLKTVGDIAKTDAGKGTAGRIAALKTLDAAQQSFFKEIQRAAKTKAAGDERLTQVYTDQMMGQPIQPGAIMDITRERYLKGKGFGDYLDSTDSNEIRRTADQRYQELKKAAAQDLGLGVTQSDKELKEQAINEAMEAWTSRQGTQGINEVKRQSFFRTDNPAIKAGIPGTMLAEFDARASELAWMQVAKDNELTPQQILAIKNGTPESEGISKEKAMLIARAVNTESVMQEYALLEKQKPGLGYEVQQWMSTALPDMARAYTGSQNSMKQAVIGDAVLDKAQTMVSRYTSADEMVIGRARAATQEVYNNSKHPEMMWPILLHNSELLSDSQRATVYREIIQPVIKRAQSIGSNNDNTSGMVMTALSQYKSDDKATMGALKAFMNSLPKEIDKYGYIFEAAAANPFWPQRDKIEARAMNVGPNSQLTKLMPWLNQ